GATRGQHGGEGVPRVLVADPVADRGRPPCAGQVRTRHPVAVDGGVLRGQGLLQRRCGGGVRGGHECLAAVPRISACVASEAEMLASNWASDGGAVARWVSSASDAASSASRR